MSFRIVVFAAVVFTCQVNAQMGGIIRPFATGFTNGLTEMTKPFVQLGQSFRAPDSEYASGRRPQVSQWMSYPSQIIPQVQNGAYEGYEAVASGMPGVGYFQIIRPNPAFKPQMQYYPISSQPGLVRPPHPYLPPAPTTSSLEESGETFINGPSNLLIKPDTTEVEVPKPEVSLTPESNFGVPTLQRPLPIIEDRK